jgi:hypothetical protein
MIFSESRFPLFGIMLEIRRGGRNGASQRKDFPVCGNRNAVPSAT